MITRDILLSSKAEGWDTHSPQTSISLYFSVKLTLARHFVLAAPQLLSMINCFFISDRPIYGSGFSGLEYDYKGLIDIYTKTENPVECAYWEGQLTQWEREREQAIVEEAKSDPLLFLAHLTTCEAIYKDLQQEMVKHYSTLSDKYGDSIDKSVGSSEWWTKLASTITINELPPDVPLKDVI